MSSDEKPKETTPPAATAAAAANANPPEKELPPWLIQAKKYLEFIKNIFSKIKNSTFIIGTSQFIKKMGWSGWFKVLAILTLIFVTVILFKSAPKIKNIWDFPYPATVSELANFVRTIPDDEEIIKYSNDLLAPQYIVQLNKIVVNLKPSPRSTTNPMMAFDLYLKADSEEATVEIKNREKQFQDHMQRFTESLSYDQILTEEGKISWKTKMKKELNSVLNNGKVKDIYFKNLIIKP